MNFTFFLELFKKSFFQFLLGSGEIFFPLLGIYFLFFGGWKIGRLLFIKFSLKLRKGKYKEIEHKIESLENISEETIDAVIREELEPYLHLQNKLFTHVNNYLLLGFLGTIIGLVFALSEMKGILALENIPRLAQNFDKLFPKLSLAFWTTIIGIVANIVGKFIYHSLDIIPLMEKIKSEFVQKYEGAKHPMERMFEKFINEFSIRFKEDFLQDFSKTVREGFNEGVKEFGQSIDSMKDSIIGTMERLNNIGSNLETFSNAFRSAGETIAQMDELIKSLNFSLAEHGERISMINKQMIEQSATLNEIYNYLIDINNKFQSIADRFQDEHTLRMETFNALAENNEKLTAFSSVLENNTEAIQKNNELSMNVFEAIQQLNNNELELANTTEELKQKIDNLNMVFAVGTDALNKALQDLTGETSEYSSLIKELLSSVASTRKLMHDTTEMVMEMVEDGKDVVNLQSNLIEVSKGLIEQFNGVANLIDGLHQKQESMVSNFRDFIEGQREREERYIKAQRDFIASIKEIENSMQRNIREFNNIVANAFKGLSRNYVDEINRDLKSIALSLNNLKGEIRDSIEINFEILKELIEKINDNFHLNSH